MPYDSPVTVRKSGLADRIEALPISAAKRNAARDELERAELAVDRLLRVRSSVRRTLASLRKLLKVHQPRHG